MENRELKCEKCGGITDYKYDDSYCSKCYQIKLDNDYDREDDLRDL